MASPRRRIPPLVILIVTLVMWAIVAAYARSVGLEGGKKLALLMVTTPFCVSIAIILMAAADWKDLSMYLPKRNFSIDWEVIPLERWRPPELGPRTGRKPVVVVPGRHIRRVPPIPAFHLRRRSLGLPADPPPELNRKRIPKWFRRLTAW